MFNVRFRMCCLKYMWHLKTLKKKKSVIGFQVVIFAVYTCRYLLLVISPDFHLVNIFELDNLGRHSIKLLTHVKVLTRVHSN